MTIARSVARSIARSVASSPIRGGGGGPGPVALFDQIMGLRTLVTPNGRTSTNALKVPGVDAMPTGWSIVGTTLNIGSAFSGDIEDWDFTDFGLSIASMNVGHIRQNIFAQTIPGIGFRHINILSNAAAQSIQYNTFTGPSNYWGVGSAINFAMTGTGRSATIGECPLIAHNRFIGLTADHIKPLGTKAHASQVFEWNYFGWPVNLPQEEPLAWSGAVTYAEGDYVRDLARNPRGMISIAGGNLNNPVPTGTVSDANWTVLDPHADAFQVVVAFTRLDIRRNLFDWAKPAGVFNQGVTQALRLSRDLGALPYDEINADENIVFWDSDSHSSPLTADSRHGMHDFIGPIRFRNNWLQPQSSGAYFHPATNGHVDEWTNNRNVDTDALITGPVLRLPPVTITSIVLGQSEMEYLFNVAPLYTGITYPTPGNGNVIVFSNDTVRTVVNAASVAAETVNPAMATLSAILDYIRPGVTFVVGDAAVVGTSRRELHDDSDTDRNWSDLVAVVGAIETEFGQVDLLVECWYNADAAFIPTFYSVFSKHYFGINADGSEFTLGDTAISVPMDHCFWDAIAASDVKGRGIFARDETSWAVLGPMPFWDLPTAPATERENFSGGSAPRLSEPARAGVIALGSEPIAQSVGVVVGPSAHICRFGGTSTDIHPDVGTPDGQTRLVMPIAIALARKAGLTINEPAIVGIEGPTDGTYADLVVSLPNGGNLTTIREFHAIASPSPEPPHYQEVIGVEISRGATRRPVFKTAETSYPIAHRGTVVIQDTGSGSPRRGRVRVTPETPFEFGDQLSYLRGQATGGLLEPRDQDALLYRDMLMEHVPAWYDSTNLYGLDGIPVRPFQEDIQVLVPDPVFSARSTRFTSGSSTLTNTSMSYAGGTEGTVAFWMYVDEATWPTGGVVFNLRNGGTIVLQVVFTSLGRLSLTLSGATGFSTPSSTFTVGRWHHVILSFKSGTGAFYQVAVDGVQLTPGPTQDLTAVSLGINATLTRAYIWSGSGTANSVTADIAYLYINFAEALDLSVSSNIEKFILAGEPVNMGGNGQLPTGSSPAFFFDGGASMSNLGTAGSLTATALTAGGTPLLP